MSRKIVLNEEAFKLAVSKSKSVAQVIRTLGLRGSSAMYNRVKEGISLFNLDISHFTNQGWAKGQKAGTNPSIRSKYSAKDLGPGLMLCTKYLRRILLDELNYLYECSVCGIDSWCDKSITLQIDHISGDSTDSSPSNLRFLCPNCHSQTETYCMGNHRKGVKFVSVTDEQLLQKLRESDSIRQALIAVGMTARGSNYNRAYELCAKYSITFGISPEVIPEAFEYSISVSNRGRERDRKYYCLDCGIEVSFHADRCKSCAGIECNPTKIDWPSKEELSILVWQKSTLQLANELGVSDKAIEKKCRKLGIEKPPRGYWRKKETGHL